MNKIPILLAMLALCNSVCVPSNYAFAAEEESSVEDIMTSRDLLSLEPNKALTRLIKFTDINVSENSVGILFYPFMPSTELEPAFGLKHFYLASYNYHKVTQDYADAHLSELGVRDIDEIESDWGAVVVEAHGFLKMGKFSLGVGASGPDYVKNGPGIMYYAAEIYDKATDEEYWVRGKISYRDQMYYHDAWDKMIYNCKGGILTSDDTYLFWREDGSQPTPEDDVAWSKDWHDLMLSELGTLEEDDIDTWNGDESKKEEIFSKLSGYYDAALDAEQTDDLRVEINRLKDKFEKLVQDFEDESKNSGSTGSEGGDNDGDEEGSEGGSGDEEGGEGGNDEGDGSDEDEEDQPKDPSDDGGETGGSDGPDGSNNGGGEGGGQGSENASQDQPSSSSNASSSSWRPSNNTQTSQTVVGANNTTLGQGMGATDATDTSGTANTTPITPVLAIAATPTSSQKDSSVSIDDQSDEETNEEEIALVSDYSQDLEAALPVLSDNMSRAVTKKSLPWLLWAIIAPGIGLLGYAMMRIYKRIHNN